MHFMRIYSENLLMHLNPDSKKIKINGKLRALSLFTGAGGFDLGFLKAGYKVVAAVEIWEPAVKTYKKNFKHSNMISGDIRDDEIKKKIYKLDDIHVIIAGIPCQAYSMTGNRFLDDERGKLYLEFLEVLNELKPFAFVIENVKGLLSVTTIENPTDDEIKIMKRMREFIGLKKRISHKEEIIYAELQRYEELKQDYESMRDKLQKRSVKLLPILISSLEKTGYYISYKVLNSADYGSAQKRPRVFIVGIRKDLNLQYNFPESTIKKHRSVEDCIGDLMDVDENFLPNHVFTEHKDETIERLSNVKEGENLYPTFSNAWYRLKRNEPSRCVLESHGGHFIHYEKDRVLTPRELARLQSFDDKFVFEGSKSEILTQIGNAVDVRQSFAIGVSLKHALAKRLKFDRT